MLFTRLVNVIAGICLKIALTSPEQEAESEQIKNAVITCAGI